MNKKVIVFDKDGVIFDTIEMSYFMNIDTLPNLTRKEHRDFFIGNVHEEISKYKSLPSTVYKQRTPEEQEAHTIEYAEKKSQVPVFPGMLDLLQTLKDAGYVLTMNTAAYERNTTPLLQRSGIADFFDFIGTYEVSPSKVEKFRIIQEQYGLEKSDMIFITDTLGDIREADKAGIQTVAVTWGAHNHEYFQMEPHDNLVAIVDTVGELQEAIEKYL